MKEVCCLCACGFLLLFSSSISHSSPYLPPSSFSSLSLPSLLSPPIPPPSLLPSLPPSLSLPPSHDSMRCEQWWLYIATSVSPDHIRMGKGWRLSVCPVGYPLMRDKRTCQFSEFCVCVCGGGGVHVHVHGKLSNKTPPHGHVPVSTNALFF